MPWHLSNKAKGCSGWAVVKDSDGSVAGCHPTKAKAQAHMAALYANTPDAKGLLMDEPKTGEHEVRILGLGGLEIRHSGRADEAFTIRGYAAVYNQISLDLGGFREQIAPGAFDEVLSTKPDVHFLWDHDRQRVGARTTNGTLNLESDTTGLFIDAQIGDYSWAKDLRKALERGDINQGSFSFNVAEDGDEWAVDENDKVLRTVHKVGGLYDVTVTAQGAYPQTSLAAVRSLAAVTGRPPEVVGAVLVAEETEIQTQGEPESHEGSEGNREKEILLEGLKRRLPVRRDRISKLEERLGKLYGGQNA